MWGLIIGTRVKNALVHYTGVIVTSEFRYKKPPHNGGVNNYSLIFFHS